MKRFHKKRSNDTGLHRPFEQLQDLLSQNGSTPSRKSRTSTCSRSFPFTETVSQRPLESGMTASAIPSPDIASSDISDISPPDIKDEMRLFREAMADVAPLHAEERCDGKPCRPGAADGAKPPGNETTAVRSLKRLLESGDGFVVSNTPEYMEGRGYNVSPEITDRLHGGEFSIQAHIDLHGMDVSEAWEAFDGFLKQSLAVGVYGVLIVHGRGLSSRTEPVLKTRVCQWLTSGPWRKWVVAFTSARSCDGGAGATYVLLRRRPVTKRLRKRKTAAQSVWHV